MFPKSGMRTFNCSVCNKQITVNDTKIEVEKHKVHKACFNCAICSTPLLVGRCSLDDGLYPAFGPMWFCPAHMMLGSGEKYDRLCKKYGTPSTKKQPQYFSFPLNSDNKL